MSEILKTGRFNPDRIVPLIMQNGAVAVSLIRESFRRKLEVQTRAVQTSSFRIQGVSLNDLSGENSVPIFEELKGELEGFVTGRLKLNGVTCLADDFAFKGTTLNSYEKGARIPAHPDRNCVGVVLVAVIDREEGDFSTYSYASGKPERVVRISNKPGDVIIMRGPGFLNTEDEVFHSISSTSAGNVLVFRKNI